MKTLLRIDASLRKEGSYSYGLTEYFSNLWLEHNPGGEVIHRCLSEQPIPHLTNEGFNSFADNNSVTEAARLSDELIQELLMADVLLIGSPLYNLSVSSPLKAYFDHVVRSGKTFEYTDTGCAGLVRNKTAVLISSRGGLVQSGIKDDFQTEYLSSLLGFIGFDSVESFCLDGTSLAKDEVKLRAVKVKQLLKRYFDKPEYPEWKGRFTEQDQVDIAALRKAQANAILAGDALAYTDLCAEDIRLMLPGYPTIIGREAFLTAEQKVFSNAKFIRFEKYPLMVECMGDLAFETGVQEVEIAGNQDKGGVYSSNQKYTHIFRKTEQGWRFAVLTSNANE